MKIFKGITEKGNVLKHVTLDGVRIHLKTDESKLWINGYYILHLNNTANFILSNFIDSCYEVPQNKIFQHTISKIKGKYKKVNVGTLEADLHQIIGVINSFARNEIPTHLVGMKEVKDSDVKAPNRMDLSLTYECDNKCPHCYLPKNADEKGRLSKTEWKGIIDKLWSIGIPQIVFTGGECTMRSDLIELISYSKQFATGIISNGTLIDEKMAKDFVKAELDWIQITLETYKENVHDEMQGRENAFNETVKGIKNCVEAGLQVSINATLTKKNYRDLKGLIDFAKQLGVGIVSTNAIISTGRGMEKKATDGLLEETLKEILIEGKKYAEKRGIAFNWFLPSCYKKLNPIEMGFGQRCCSACQINMMIEPNGDVIPCQSWTHEKLGNMPKDKWKDIWNSKVAKKIRKNEYANEECTKCEFFDKCKGGCPLDKDNRTCQTRK